MRTLRSRRAGAALIAAAVLLTGATAVTLLHSHPHNGRRQAVAVPPAASRSAQNPARATHRARAVAPINAAALRWVDFHGMQLPISAADGPRDTRGGLASGFTDTPTGALLAAINIAVRTAFLWGPPIFEPTISRQVTGPDAATLLSSQAAAYRQLRPAAHVRTGQPIGRGYAAEAGYRLITYTPADATFDVVAAGPGPNGITVLTDTRLEVVRRGGDWRVVAPPDGNWETVATRVWSLSGYTAFPGQG